MVALRLSPRPQRPVPTASSQGLRSPPPSSSGATPKPPPRGFWAAQPSGRAAAAHALQRTDGPRGPAPPRGGGGGGGGGGSEPEPEPEPEDPETYLDLAQVCAGRPLSLSGLLQGLLQRR